MTFRPDLDPGSAEFRQIETVVVSSRWAVACWVVFQIGFNSMMSAVFPLSNGNESGGVMAWLLTSELVWFVALILLSISVWRLARGLESSAPWAWVMGFWFAIGISDIIIMYFLRRDVTRWCREHGVPAGWFGPSRATASELRDRRMLYEKSRA